MAPFIEEAFREIFVSLGLISQHDLLSGCCMWLKHTNGGLVKLPGHFKALTMIGRLAPPPLLLHLIQIDDSLIHIAHTRVF